MKIICLGRNYTQSHNAPGENTQEPIVFLKPDRAILKDNNPFFIPDFAKSFEYEGELVFHINRLGKNISERFAHRYYDAVTVGLDIASTDLLSSQIQDSLPWDLAKGFDGSALLGEFIPVDNLDVTSLMFSVRSGNDVLQRGNSTDQVWSIDKIVAYVSQFYTLKIGDLIYAGAPQVARTLQVGQKLQGFLEDKQVFDIDIR